MLNITLEVLASVIKQYINKQIKWHEDWKGRNKVMSITDYMIVHVENSADSTEKLLE